MSKIPTDAEAIAWLAKGLGLKVNIERPGGIGEQLDETIKKLDAVQTAAKNKERLIIAANIANGFCGNMGVRLHEEEDLQKMISVAVPAFVKIADALIAECEKPQKQ